MKKIPLSNGKFAIVDDDDFCVLNRFHWQFHKHNGCHRKIHNDFSDGVYVFPIAEMICGDKKPGYRWYYKNGNKLDCRKSNIVALPYGHRIELQNKRRNCSVKYKGVHYWIYPRKNSYQAYINNNGIRYHLGTYNTAEKAAIAYNKKARELYGELAYQNKIGGQ